MAAATVEDVGIEASFNTGKSDRGMKRFLSGFTGIDMAQQKATRSGKSFAAVTGGMGKAATGAASLSKQMVGVAGGMLAFSGISGVFGMLSSQMPVIGQAFSNMGRVITANLIWPMVQEVLPLVYQLTDWVRDNRTKFVQLGVVIINVFRAAKTIIGAVFSLGSTFADAFFGKIDGGTLTFKKFIDFLNFMLLKVVFLFTFLLITMEPAIAAIGGLLGNLFNNIIAPFYDGFFSQMVGLGAVFQDFAGLIAMVAGDLSGAFGGSFPIMRTLGELIGGTIVGALQMLVDLGRAMYQGVWKPLFSGLVEGFGDAFAGAGDFGSTLAQVGTILKSVFGFLLWAITKSAPVFRFLGKLIGTVLGGALKIIGGLIGGIVELFTYFTTDLPKDIGGGIDYIVGRFTNLKNAVVRAVTGIIDRVKDIGRTIWDFITGLFSNMGNAIKNALTGAISFIGDELKNSQLGQLLIGLVGSDGDKNDPVIDKTPGRGGSGSGGGPGMKPDPELGLRGGGSSRTTTTNNNQRTTYNIQATEPREVADEVQRTQRREEYRRMNNKKRMADE